MEISQRFFFFNITVTDTITNKLHCKPHHIAYDVQTTRALDIVIFISCSIYYFQNNHFLLPNLCKKSHGQYSTHISKEYYGQLTQSIYISGVL